MFVHLGTNHIDLCQFSGFEKKKSVFIVEHLKRIWVFCTSFFCSILNNLYFFMRYSDGEVYNCLFNLQMESSIPYLYPIKFNLDLELDRLLPFGSLKRCIGPFPPLH
jgi:hypothetical protein